MQALLRSIALIAAVAGAASAEAKEYSYAQRDQFCLELFGGLFSGDDKLVEQTIRDNTKVNKEKLDIGVSQAILSGKMLRESIKEAKIKRVSLAESKDFGLLNQRYYLIDVGEGLFLAYCFVRDYEEKVQFIQFSMTSQESELSKFFARGW